MRSRFGRRCAGWTVVALICIGVFGGSIPAVRITDFLLDIATVAFLAAVLRAVGVWWGPTRLADPLAAGDEYTLITATAMFE